MNPTYIIGIDPGVTTGFAIWSGTALIEVKSTSIHNAIERIRLYKENHYNIFIRVEDARLRKWFGQSGREQLQGAGSIKRDCKIWQDFLTDENIPFEMVAPKNNKTKVNADMFRKITKWDKPTNEHGRDAAFLVFGYNVKECFKNQLVK